MLKATGLHDYCLTARRQVSGIARGERSVLRRY